MKRKLTILATIVAIALIALAWHAPTVTGSVSCDHGTQTGHVTAHNDESETATVRSSSGPIFLVGDTIPAHSTKTETFTRPGSFTGNVTVSFAVDFPSDGTDRSATVTLHFSGGCVQPPMTTSTTAAPTTSTTAGTPPTLPPALPEPPPAKPAAPTVTPPEFAG